MNLLKTLILCFLLTIFSACSNRSIYVGDLPEGQVVDDRMAIDFTRSAISQSGIDVSNMTPVMYGDNGKYFAKNKFNLNSGYVLWKRIGSAELYDYFVSINYKFGRIYCSVENVK